MDWTSIISATLIATIITVLANLHTSRRKEFIDNIIIERREWRKYMQALVEKLQKTSDMHELNILLADLKVRINAFGYADKDDYLWDGHIWDLVKKLENCEDTNGEFKDTKKKLIHCISCLLKYDWERTKAEITGNHYVSLCIGCCLFFIINFVALIALIGIPNNNNQYLNTMISSIMIIPLLLIIICAFNVFSIFSLNRGINKILVCAYKEKNTRFKKGFTILFRLNWNIFFLVISFVGYIRFNNYVIQGGLLFTLVFSVISFVIVLYCRLQKYDSAEQYYLAIEKILE